MSSLVNRYREASHASIEKLSPLPSALDHATSHADAAA